MEYQEFLESKIVIDAPSGHEPVDINPQLFDFQKDLVSWAVRRGRAAIFADCGLGKTPMQLEWARQVKGDVIILAPLAVTGQVVSRAASKGEKSAWYCICDCGEKVIATSTHLRSGHTQSCGCLCRERTSAARRTHGHTVEHKSSPTFSSWQSMKARCMNPKSNRYKAYHDRGITICARWLDSFENFLADMGERPAA